MFASVTEAKRIIRTFYSDSYTMQIDGGPTGVVTISLVSPKFGSSIAGLIRRSQALNMLRVRCPSTSVSVGQSGVSFTVTVSADAEESTVPPVTLVDLAHFVRARIYLNRSYMRITAEIVRGQAHVVASISKRSDLDCNLRSVASTLERELRTYGIIPNIQVSEVRTNQLSGLETALDTIAVELRIEVPMSGSKIMCQAFHGEVA